MSASKPPRLPIGPHKFRPGDIVRLGGKGCYVVLRAHGLPTAGDAAQYDLKSVGEGAEALSFAPSWRLTRVMNPKPLELQKGMALLVMSSGRDA